MAREISDEEAAALGLPVAAQPRRRELTDDEAKALGLPTGPPSVQPVPEKNLAGKALDLVKATTIGALEGGDLGLGPVRAGVVDALTGGTFGGGMEKAKTRLGAVRAASPGAYDASRFAGTMATSMLAPGANSGALGARLGTQAGLGGVQGAAETEGDAGERARGAAVNGLLSLAGAGAGEGLGLVLRSAAPGLKQDAIDQGRRVLLNGADTMSSRVPTSPAAVEEALQSGAIRMGSTTEAAAGRLKALTGAQGAEYSRIVTELEKRGVQGPDAIKLADELLAKAAELRPGEQNPAVLREYAKQADMVLDRAGGKDFELLNNELFADAAGAADRPRLGLTNAENLKRSLQRDAKFGRMENTPVMDAKQDIASMFRQANEDVIEQAGRAAGQGSETAVLAEKFVPVKQRLGRLIEAREAAKRGAQRGAQRMGVGINDVLAMAAAHPLAAIQTVNKAAGNRIASTKAAGGYALANALEQGAWPGSRVASPLSPYLSTPEDDERTKRQALIDALLGRR